MKIFFLLLFIALLGTFIFLKVQIMGDPNSDFNKTTRYNLGKYQLVRSALGMHSYGDARNWFLGSQNVGIVVEVVQARGTNIEDYILDNFAKDIKTYTGKQVTIANTDLIKSSTLTDADLKEISKGYRHKFITGYSNLFVVYATDFEREGTEVGKTFSEFGIVLSDKRLREVAGNNRQALSELIESTLLHEFGHQLSLEHNTEPGCVMNEQVEKPITRGVLNSIFTSTEFCNLELNQLKTIKALAP